MGVEWVRGRGGIWWAGMCVSGGVSGCIVNEWMLWRGGGEESQEEWGSKTAG